MKFWEAMKLLQERKKVRRIVWEKDDYLYRTPTGKICRKSQGSKFDLNTLENNHFDDWEEFEKKGLSDLDSQLVVELRAYIVKLSDLTILLEERLKEK